MALNMRVLKVSTHQSPPPPNFVIAGNHDISRRSFLDSRRRHPILDRTVLCLCGKSVYLHSHLCIIFTAGSLKKLTVSYDRCLE